MFTTGQQVQIEKIGTFDMHGQLISLSKRFWPHQNIDQLEFFTFEEKFKIATKTPKQSKLSDYFCFRQVMLYRYFY